MKVIFSILIIVAMILIHEWGHFIAGRICKVPVYEFSLGFGPKLFQKQGKKETVYSVRAIPLGGYCSFDKGDNTGTLDFELNKQPLRKRMFIFFAGPLMNIVSAFVIAVLLFACVGVPTPSTLVASTYPDYNAAQVLQEGDRLLVANGVELNNSPQILSDVIAEAGETPIVFEFDRNGEIMSAEITPKFNQEENKYFIGIVYAQETIRINFFESIASAGALCVQYASLIFVTLKGLFTGLYSINDMASIVGIVGVMTEYAEASKLPIFFELCAYISVNLGVINLLPIPGLDGSKLLFGAIEGITRKKVPSKVETYLTLACMALLFALSGYLILHDIFKLFS